jgi:hypothetical protein
MNIRAEEVYRSSNGDSWQLVSDPSTQQLLVRHVPNASSGGAAKETPVDDFLRVDGSGPEFAAIRRAAEAWLPDRPAGRSAGFYWVQGVVGAEPAYWNGEAWSRLSPVTSEPVVLADTPLKFEDA